MHFKQTTGEKFGWLLYQAFKSSPKHQMEGLGDKWRSVWRLPKGHEERRLNAAGHFHRHQEEAAGTLVLWDPKH